VAGRSLAAALDVNRRAAALAFPVGLLCIALSSVRTWFRDADLIYFWDATIPLAPGRAFFAFARIVRDDFWPARLDLPALATIPYAGLLWLLSDFGRDTGLGERMLFTGLYAAPFLTAYVAFASILREQTDDALLRRAVAAAAALCYGCNAYVLFNLWRIFDLNVFVYGIFPLLVMFARDYLRAGRARDLAAFATVFLAGIPGYTNPATVAGMLAGLAAWIVVRCLVGRTRGCFSRAIRIGLVTGGALAPFVVPQLIGLGALVARLGAQGTWPALGSNTGHSTFWSVLRLLGDGVTYERYPNGDANYPWAAAYHADPSMIVATSIVPLLALAGAIAGRRIVDAVAASFAGAALALLALGPRAPVIGGAFFACFRAVTFCSAFRNPFDKFALTLPFFEALLVAFAFAAVARFASSRGARSIGIAIAAFAVVALPMYAGWPLFTGAVERDTSSRPSSRVRFPSDFAATTAIVERSAPVLVLPWTHVPLVAERWRSGYVGFEPLQFATYVPVASTDSEYLDTNEIVCAVEGALVAGPSPNAVAAARALGFRSIAVRLDDDPTFTPGAAAAPAIARNLAKLGLHGRRTSTVVFYDLGNVPRAIATATLIVGPPGLSSYRTGRELVADVDPAAARRASIGVVERRPLDFAFDRTSKILGTARIDGRPVRIVALSPLATSRVVPETFALDSGDGSEDYPGAASFPRMVANATRGTLATAWHQRYVETAAAIVPRAKAIALRLRLRNRSAGVAALSVDFARGTSTLGHERFDVAPRYDGEARLLAAVPRGATLAIVRLVAIPDREPVSLDFGSLVIAQYARDPRAVVTVRSDPSRVVRVIPVATSVSSAYRTTYRLPAGPPLAFTSLAASSHVDWTARIGNGPARPPDGVVQGFAPMWFVAASKHPRTITLVDRSGEIGRLVFGGLGLLDLIMLLRLWFATAFPSRRSPRGPIRATA
jgi:hypothetical protein